VQLARHTPDSLVRDAGRAASSDSVGKLLLGSGELVASGDSPRHRRGESLLLRA
jgi:hypothetical protein